MLVAVTDPAQAPETPAGKGRPTPKRSESQKRRRQPVPADKKEAQKQRKERMREQRMQQRQALLSGDERHLPPRDAGPARRLARDVVDSRFTLGQIFFGLIVVVLLASLVVRPHTVAATLINLLSFATVIVVFVDSYLLGRKARRAVAAAYDEKNAYGITSYAAVRAMQPRRFRRPPPKVKRGETPGKH
jgi:Flp pilus assembly protein TadB